MDQDLDEADEAETLRVRLASSSSTTTSKAQSRSRAHLQSADADMDVLSLVSYVPLFPSPQPINQNSRTAHTPPTSNTIQRTHSA
jgi:hypothetical protein